MLIYWACHCDLNLNSIRKLNNCVFTQATKKQVDVIFLHCQTATNAIKLVRFISHHNAFTHQLTKVPPHAPFNFYVQHTHKHN